MKRICLAVLLVVVTTGCAAPEASPQSDGASDIDTVAAGEAVPPDDDTGAAPSDAQTPTDAPANPTDSPDEPADDSPSTDTADDQDSAAAPAPEQSSAPQGEQQSASRETSEELPFEVTLSATCLRHGDEVTIEIRTDPVVGVAYHAVYAGEEGGAPPPYGGGHGGNGGDMTDEQGRYSDSWIVGASAPEGPGRIDIVVGARDQHWQYEEPIEVANRLTGTCENGD